MKVICGDFMTIRSPVIASSIVEARVQCTVVHSDLDRFKEIVIKFCCGT